MIQEIIKQAKQEVIDEIKILKFNFKENCRTLTKEKLIKMFQDFTLEDFSCFAKDGNTYLKPEEYYKNISIEKLEREQQLTDTQMNFHCIDGELGVNLLKCCDRCKKLFLENRFKTYVYVLLKRGGTHREN